MNSIIFIGAGIILLIVILAKIPGLEHMVRPIIELIFTAIKASLEQAFYWSVWVIKIVFKAHVEFFRNLIFAPEDVDATYSFRQNADN